MVFLHDKFNGALDRKISSKEIWSHLTEMYDLNALVCFNSLLLVLCEVCIVYLIDIFL